ncbi:MAG: ABC transporter permease [candidate division Zixibacteria bacterium]|nr:ABC transporter permease [candidate division Zixibacteria bacterium]
MGKVITLAGKDLRLLVRDKSSLFWVIMFPLLIALFFGTIFSGSGGQMSGMKVAVIDEDQSEFSQAYISQLDSLEALSITPMVYDSAFQKVRTGRLAALIVLKKGFGQTGGLFSDTPLVEVGIDPSRRTEAGYLQGLLAQASFMQLHGKYSSPSLIREQLDKLTLDSGAWKGLDSRQLARARSFLSSMADFFESLEELSIDSTADEPSKRPAMFAVKVTSVTNDVARPRSSFEVTFPSAVLWGLMGVAATFAVGIVKERNGGTYLRLRLAPVTRTQILAGKGLACFTASFFIGVMLLALGTVVFGVRIVNPGILAVSLVAACLCFVGLTMMVSAIGKSEEAVAGAGWGILLVMAMIGGGMLPLMFMPGWLKTLSHFSPVKWGILAIEGGIWRDFTYTEIWLPVVILLGIGTLCFSAGVTLLSRTDR